MNQSQTNPPDQADFMGCFIINIIGDYIMILVLFLFLLQIQGRSHLGALAAVKTTTATKKIQNYVR
jgi:hypothetical protein